MSSPCKLWSWEMGKGKENHKSNCFFENTIMKLNIVHANFKKL